MPYIDFAGNTRELPAGETLVGSGPQAGWRLQNDGLAPRHFTLTVRPDGGTLVCPHSARTVVAVNGERLPLHPTPLEHGDVLLAGGATMVYLERLAEAPRRASAESAATGHLVNDAAGEAYPLDRPVVRIGRGAGSDVFVPHPSVSRAHAEVRAEAGGLVLHSFGSSGTRVNGHSARVTVLEEGDVIAVGATELRFTRGPLPEGARVLRDAGGRDAAVTDRGTTVVRAEDVAAGDAPRARAALVAALVAITAAAAWWLLR